MKLLGFNINMTPRDDSVRFRVCPKAVEQSRQNTVLFFSVGKRAAFIRTEKDYITNLAGARRKETADAVHIRGIYPDAAGQDIPALAPCAEDVPIAVMMKRFLSSVEVIVFDEPAFGLDAEGRLEVYEFINALAESGKGIVLISADMGEIEGMSDRVMTLD
ncbi:MAG: hypothetical protein LBO21_07695 [Synergistaceae bacterium]|nr:hypothetical protein [Synergistaceae bacterium]